MARSFLGDLLWFTCAGLLALLLAGRQKRLAQGLLMRFFGPSGFSLALYIMLTLPGVFVHEGAHALSAVVLRVPVRNVIFIPRRSADDLSLTAFVRVEQRDSLRMAAIALAPLLAGSVILGLLARTLGSTELDPRPWIRLADWLQHLDLHSTGIWASIYLLWSISSHMTPSPADLRYLGGCIVPLLLLLAAGLILALTGSTIPEEIGRFTGQMGDGLALGAALNAILLLPLTLLSRLPRKR